MSSIPRKSMLDKDNSSFDEENFGGKQNNEFQQQSENITIEPLELKELEQEVQLLGEKKQLSELSTNLGEDLTNKMFQKLEEKVEETPETGLDIKRKQLEKKLSYSQSWSESTASDYLNEQIKKIQEAKKEGRIQDHEAVEWLVVLDTLKQKFKEKNLNDIESYKKTKQTFGYQVLSHESYTQMYMILMISGSIPSDSIHSKYKKEITAKIALGSQLDPLQQHLVDSNYGLYEIESVDPLQLKNDDPVLYAKIAETVHNDPENELTKRDIEEYFFMVAMYTGLNKKRLAPKTQTLSSQETHKVISESVYIQEAKAKNEETLNHQKFKLPPQEKAISLGELVIKSDKFLKAMSKVYKTQTRPTVKFETKIDSISDKIKVVDQLNEQFKYDFSQLPQGVSIEDFKKYIRTGETIEGIDINLLESCLDDAIQKRKMLKYNDAYSNQQEREFKQNFESVQAVSESISSQSGLENTNGLLFNEFSYENSAFSYQGEYGGKSITIVKDVYGNTTLPGITDTYIPAKKPFTVKDKTVKKQPVLIGVDETIYPEKKGPSKEYINQISHQIERNVLLQTVIETTLGPTKDIDLLGSLNKEQIKVLQIVDMISDQFTLSQLQQLNSILSGSMFKNSLQYANSGWLKKENTTSSTPTKDISIYPESMLRYVQHVLLGLENTSQQVELGLINPDRILHNAHKFQKLIVGSSNSEFQQDKETASDLLPGYSLVEIPQRKGNYTIQKTVN